MAKRCIYASVIYNISGLVDGMLPVWHQAIIWTNANLFDPKKQISRENA